MSHSLVPQWVYNKIYPLNKDWLYLTKLKNDYSFEWSKEDDCFEAKDDNLNKIFRYERGLYQMFINDKLVEQFGDKKPKKITNTFRFVQKPILRQKNIKKWIPVLINSEHYVLKDDRLIKITPIISKMQSYQLYQYYKSLDPEDKNIDLKHFGLVQNECIKRNLLPGEIQSLNNFNLEIPVSNTK
jgi:hypothetical protein